MKTQPVMMTDILMDYGKRVNTHSKKMNYENAHFPPGETILRLPYVSYFTV